MRGGVVSPPPDRQGWVEIMNWVSINPARGPDGLLPGTELFYLSVK